MEITIIKNTDTNYFKYDNQCQPQPAQVYLDCESQTLSSCYDSNIGFGCSGYVWHRRHLTFGISSYLTVTAINNLLESLKTLAQTVVDGYECAWDGSNHVGKYTDNAEDAISEMQRLCEQCESETFAVYAWGDWFDFSDWVETASEYDSLADMESAEPGTGNCPDDIIADDLEDFIVESVESELSDAVSVDEYIASLPVWVKKLDRVKKEIEEYQSE